jgi:hypothetical protein
LNKTLLSNSYFNGIMSNRVTIMLDDDNNKMIRTHQVRMIQKKNGAYSFSKSINDLLRSRK